MRFRATAKEGEDFCSKRFLLNQLIWDLGYNLGMTVSNYGRVTAVEQVFSALSKFKSKNIKMKVVKLHNQQRQNSKNFPKTT